MGQTLTQPFGTYGEFGQSAAISSDGTRIAIGVPTHAHKIEYGKVRVYEYNSTHWNQLGLDIIGPSWTGWSVSLSSDGAKVAVATPSCDIYETGAFSVHNWDGTEWTRLGQEIKGPGRDGWALSLSSDGTRLAVGASNWQTPTRVYEYYDSLECNWIKVFDWAEPTSAALAKFWTKDSKWNLLTAPPFYVKRACHICADTHKTIIYKRRTPVANIDFKDLFLNNWFDDPAGSSDTAKNKFHIDFDLYSSLEDASNDRNEWQFCNFNDPGVGFPRECGPVTSVPVQWISLTKNRLKYVSFYVLRV